jgi:hypothetical protein
MTPAKERFNFFIETCQLAGLRAIEERTGARVAEQIRRAVAAYLESQRVLPKAEMRKILGGAK